MKDIAPDITLVGVNIPQINYSQLTMGEEIGKGGWGVVYRATYEGEALWSGQNENEVFYYYYGFFMGDINFFFLGSV